MNPFFERIVFSFVLFLIFQNALGENLRDDNTAWSIFWAVAVVLIIITGARETLDWWKNYRGITTDGAIISDGGVVLKRKLRG